VCFDMTGKEVWRRNIEKDYGQFAFQWTFSTSPLLHDGRLVSPGAPARRAGERTRTQGRSE